jgi:Flp pilus assembly protein TadG
MTILPVPRRARPRSLRRDRRGAAAVETALVMLPFMLLLLGTIQIGIYFMTQSALSTGVLATASAMRAAMLTAGSAYTAPTASSLTSSITSNAGALVSTSNVTSDLQLLSNLSGAIVPIANGTINIGSVNSVLVLRASAPVTTFVPGIGSLSVTSTAIFRWPSS